MALARRASLSLCLSSSNKNLFRSQYFLTWKYLTCSNQVTMTFCFPFSQLNSWRFLSLPLESLYIILAVHLHTGPVFKICPQPDYGEENCIWFLSTSVSLIWCKEVKVTLFLLLVDPLFSYLRFTLAILSVYHQIRYLWKKNILLVFYYATAYS